jgi:hypothetical protein
MRHHLFGPHRFLLRSSSFGAPRAGGASCSTFTLIARDDAHLTFRKRAGVGVTTSGKGVRQCAAATRRRRVDNGQSPACERR